ncbi:hypothetical protein EYZ11_000379 [Aspergillus tanneri]|uniref:Granulins domain-containing protein n=1 Tax=Aspergillus tanneri TaxID=1220188 RepID=A0A4S3JXK7_9EURO|nr:uncharacterized protein ATNIH1004_004329 [Aspergillus tanneri]KAA8648444.1 hypothetical protein ATNIH1004_004329 [Aspergillus tanneri]THD00188.1 hypothetical protein EYZ11_000379 [Aspergillus tanneri]
MLSSLLLLTPLLASQVLAVQSGVHIAGMEIFKRQSDSEAFVPNTTPGCPDSWPTCGTSGICYNPNEGQTCCPGGKYACPSGSFCLQDPYCCPNGLDPETCAKRYGITLTPSSPEPTETDQPTEPTASVPSPSSSSSASIPVIPRPTSSTSSSPVSSSSAHSTAPTASPSSPLFTGGANAREMIGGAAIVLGGLGFLGNMI